MRSASIEFNEFLETLPPDLSLADVCNRLRNKSSASSVARRLSKAGYKYRDGRHDRKIEQRWRDVDWSQPNSVIALAMKVSRQRVSKMRARMLSDKSAKSEPEKESCEPQN